MEELAGLMIPAAASLILFRILLGPMRMVGKILLHSGFGLLCLWFLNLSASWTGIWLPVNAVTVLTAGFLGLPGIGILALLAAL